MPRIDVVCQISDPNGDWVDVNAGVYRLSKEAFSAESVSWRRSTAVNPQVEGEWLVNAVRDNVTFPLHIWVRETGHAALSTAVETLTDLISQVNWSLRIAFEGDRTTYSCQAADYMLEYSQELRHATMAHVKADVIRLPASTRDAI